MSDTLGRITVPSPVSSGSTWSLVSDYPVGLDWDFPIITHRFQARATLSMQRYQVGVGNRHFHWRKAALSFAEKATLLAFYNSMQGSYKSFIYPAPNSDRTTFTNFTVIFDTPPVSFEDLASMCRAGFTFVETDAASSPSYSVAATVGFPFTAALTDLLDQVQVIIPLVHIRVRNPTVPDIYLSDRRVTVGGQLYLPRVLGIGDPTSDVLITQSLSGAADNVSFTFGNADRAMSALAADCSLVFASVDLCFYHVNSSKLLQIWKGIVKPGGWSFDGGPEFHVSCSDGLYPITQSYPLQTVTRECANTFNVAPRCPWSTTHTLDTSLDVTKCDYHFNTPNGCLAHGMSPYFRGHPSFPQGVTIKDNGTGILNFGRSTVTSTSIVSDSIWGAVLPEIWCNDDGDPRRAFFANCLVAAVRDESDFEDVLGIVGAGPLSAYEGMSVQTNSDGFKFIVAPLADGFPPQGFTVDSQLRVTGYHPTLGLREVLGTTPVDPSTDAFSLGQGTPQRWDVPDPTFPNILTGALHNIIPLAAGTAFVELRYQKDTNKGISPTAAESHSMTVPVASGLTGVIFDTGGNRASVPGLTNPFWIALNSYFRSLGLENGTPAEQLATFVLSSLIVGDGSGTTEIADLSVVPLIGDPAVLETQFRFQGALTEAKPFRDWLVEILNCCLGYFSFEFGRLRLGIRENASVTSAFTAGNMLYQSFSVSPAEAAFEYLRVEFANRDLQYQMDRATYEDKDHELYFGRQGSPLRSSMRSVGLSTMSQALRVCATRVREEIGGILRPDLANPYIEFDNANRATWRTTLLALDTSVGQVVSVTHPDLPQHPDVATPHTWKYRVERVAIHRDYSITLTGRSVTASMYNYDVGPKPMDVSPLPVPPLFRSIPLGPAWAPYQVQADAADPLFPSEWTFEADVEYTTLADGAASTQLLVTGKLPINTFAPNVGTPFVKTVSQSTTGGFLLGGVTVRITVVAFDSTGLPSPPAEIAIVQLPASTNTNTITMSGVEWPRAAALTNYNIFASTADSLICFQATGVLTPGADPLTYTPTSITLSGALARSTYALPSPYVSRIRVKAKLGAHSGVAGMSVDAVGVNSLTLTALIDLTGTPFDPTDRVLSIIGRRSGPTPFASFRITAFNLTTGVATVTPDPTGVVQAEDAIVLRCLGYDNSASPLTFTDAGFLNSTSAHAGLNPGDEVGRLARVISGLGRGEKPRKIVANDASSVTFDLPLILDTTSILIIEEPDYPYSVDSTAFSNSDPSAAVTLGIPADNYVNQPVIIAAFTVDINGVESPEGDNPIREDWIFGNPGILGNGIIAYVDG